MEIKYLKKMLKTPTIGDEDNEGIPEVMIDGIEQAIGKKFPLAYREFLYLGGANANMLADMDHQVISSISGEEYWKEMQQYCREEMAREGIKPEKDFWAIAALDGGEQFHFFYFDDGEDPPVYYYSSYHCNYDTGVEYAGILAAKDHLIIYVNDFIASRKRSGY